MTIILTRHAKVVINQRKRLTATQMREWVKEYDCAFVSHEVPDKAIVKHLKNANIVLSSALPRTKESLEFIGIKNYENNEIFNEVEIPVFKGNMVKLYPKTWLWLFRLMLVLPVKKHHQILKESKTRAKMATVYLDRLAQENNNIALMGHAGMNWLIGKELKKLEWRAVEDFNSTKNWGYKIYKK